MLLEKSSPRSRRHSGSTVCDVDVVFQLNSNRYTASKIHTCVAVVEIYVPPCAVFFLVGPIDLSLVVS